MFDATAIPAASPPALLEERPLPQPAAGERERLAAFATVAIPCLLAGFLAFFEIAGRSLWLDEGASVAIASQHGLALWHSIEHDGGNMFAYYLFLHELLKLFGHGELVIRFASAIAAAATAGLTAELARRLFDRRIALAAGLLTAVSLTLIYWGQDARSYALMIAFISASFLSFVSLVESEDRTRWQWIAYVLSTLAAAYMSFEALLVVPAQLLSLVLIGRPRRALWSAIGVISVCSLPLLVLAEQRGPGQLFWVPRPDLAQLHQMLEALLSSGFQPNFHLTDTSTPLLLLSGVLVFAAIGRIATTLARTRRDQRNSVIPLLATQRRTLWAQTLVLSWLVIPIALSLLESYLVQPITLPRASLVVLPAASLLLAWTALAGRVAAALGWAAVFTVIALRALQLAPAYGTSPENWKGASAHVLASAKPRDCIAFYPADGRQVFSYYLGTGAAAAASAPRSVLPAAPWTLVKPFVEDYAAPTGKALDRIISTCPRIWLISSHSGQKHGPPASHADYLRFEALQGALTAAYGHHRTVSYGWAAAVRVELLRR